MPGDDQLVRVSTLARETGLSVSWLRQLADSGQIPSERTAGGHRVFRIADVRAALTRRALSGAADAAQQLGRPTWSRSQPLDRLAEDEVWTAIVSDTGLDTATPVARCMRYAFTEMANNAIDHSGGTTLAVRWWMSPSMWAFELTDDGVGAFARLRQGLGLPDDFAAIQDLTKGKRTTDPERHTGEGIFFTSKLMDLFQLTANGLRWSVDNLRSDVAVGQAAEKAGSTVLCQLDAKTARVPNDIFEQFTDELAFTKTRPVVKLFEIGVAFVSRSEARRLLEGLDQFSEVELDFSGVNEVGQGFVDEVFRVWLRSHPATTIVPTNMNRAVEFMVRRGLG